MRIRFTLPGHKHHQFQFDCHKLVTMDTGSRAFFYLRGGLQSEDVGLGNMVECK